MNTQDFITLYAPATGEQLGQIPALSTNQIDTIMTTAASVWQSWSQTTLETRSQLLKRWSNILRRDSAQLALLMSQEISKAYADSLKEVVRTADLIDYVADDALRMNGEAYRGDQFPGGSRNKIAFSHFVPLGVVLAISPFNYPVNLAAAKIAPALMMGNSVVFKPATQGALSGIALVAALIEAGMPENLVQTVTGRGSVIGDYIVKHREINMISFTGSVGIGRQISSLAAMIPQVHELGGKDAAIILDLANPNRIVSELISGAFGYSGQRCTAIKRVFVLDHLADELVSLLTPAMQSITTGLPETNAMVTPLIDNKSADFVQGLIDDAIAQGASVLFGNQREQNFMQPTLLDHVTTAMRIAWEEPFGPVLPIIRVASIDEAIRLNNQSEFGLQASIFGSNIDDIFKIAQKLQVGTVNINGRSERGPDHFPFSGVKNSGMGVQGVRRSLESMSRQQMTVLNIQN
ncbi:MAG: NADP-dependent glyceraldehyde-3-phosphate dehydrogenase [Culicoidibacterales bacterium]